MAAWWRARADEIYAAVPDLGGFVLKADSEGRLGPSAYGRTHADAANVIARALAPHGGVLLYRGFVYDHHMDWRNPRNDRARAAYDNFMALDGQFDDNVVLQVKHGPIDFQVREPASPLFAALRRTNQAIELQITQEYTGTAAARGLPRADVGGGARLRHARRAAAARPSAQLVTGRTFGRPLGGFVGVSNVGLAPNWLGHDLALANLYAFGRLAWDPGLRAERIADEWTRLTFGADPAVAPVIRGILMDSWPAYEGYTGPLGAGTLTDIINIHYGPGVESSERNGWGQWHRADEKGIGMDRTVATGTGYIGQYPAPVAAMYESLESLPGRVAPVHAPRAVHARAPLGEDGHSAHLRFALRGCRRRRGVRRALAFARGPRGCDAIPGRARAPRIPGRACGRLARCRVRDGSGGRRAFPMRPGGWSVCRDDSRQRPRSSPAMRHRRDAVGDGLAQEGRRLRKRLSVAAPRHGAMPGLQGCSTCTCCSTTNVTGPPASSCS